MRKEIVEEYWIRNFHKEDGTEKSRQENRKEDQQTQMYQFFISEKKDSLVPWFDTLSERDKYGIFTLFAVNEARAYLIKDNERVIAEKEKKIKDLQTALMTPIKTSQN